MHKILTPKSTARSATRVAAVAIAAITIVAGTTNTANAGGIGGVLRGDGTYIAAWTSCWGGTLGRSYARHGTRVAVSGWSPQRTLAYASMGRRASGFAAYYFREPRAW